MLLLPTTVITVWKVTGIAYAARKIPTMHRLETQAMNSGRNTLPFAERLTRQASGQGDAPSHLD
jgi:hypothetical protein